MFSRGAGWLWAFPGMSLQSAFFASCGGCPLFAGGFLPVGWTMGACNRDVGIDDGKMGDEATGMGLDVVFRI